MKVFGITLILFVFFFTQSFAQSCLNGNCSSGFGKFKYANGDIYEGEFYDDKREGFGIYIWKSGEKYIGESIADVFSGFGRMEYPDKTTYVGEFFNGEFGGRADYGEGEKTFPDGTKQIGLFKGGKYYGKISYYDKPIGTTGCLNGDCDEGYGMKYYSGNDRYFGYFKNKLRNGYGAYYWDDGTRWVGQFSQNLLTGYGSYFFPTGEKYVGYFIDSKRNGWGINYDPNTGEKKIGFWEDNNLVTPKSTFLKEGSVSGCISGDCKNGFGKFVYNNGFYEGNFKNGYRNGTGKYFYDIGDFYQGTFKDNKFNGKGIYYYTNGERYDGEWKDQRHHGKGQMFHFDGLPDEGYWNEGKFAGKNTAPPAYDAWVKNNYGEANTTTVANNSNTKPTINPVTTPNNTKPNNNNPIQTNNTKPNNQTNTNTKPNNNNNTKPNNNTVIVSGNNNSGLNTINYKKKVALVIGNQSYKFTTALKNPKNDARSMVQLLKSCGFEVIEVIDGTEPQMEAAIREFGAKVIGVDVAMFYYSGHGMQVDGENFMIPIDFKLQSKADIKDDCKSVSRILSRMGVAGTKLNIIILDACRNNPFDRGSFGEEDPGEGLAAIVAPNNTIIAYATQPGAVASDGVAGSNGLYTGSLIKYILLPNTDFDRALKLTITEVKEKSANKQRPWVTSDFGNYFYFIVQ